MVTKKDLKLKVPERYLYDSRSKLKMLYYFGLQIVFASRTHSQLGQFASELKRTEFASRVTTCSLGSRQNLCINPDVMKLKNLSLMNERLVNTIVKMYMI